jgi:trehalose/maltose transport system substrate-binding protein
MALAEKRWGKALTIGTAVVAASLMATACSSSKKSGGGSGGSTGGTGPITYVQGADTTGVIPLIAAGWNKDHASEKVTVKQQSALADDQHQDLVQNFQAKSSNYDVVSVDVIWTAEFAAKSWLQPLTGNLKLDTSNLLQAPVKAATYAGTLYAGPASSDGGMLYYRKDLVKNPPAQFTWDNINKICAQNLATHCYVGQFAKYEGEVCNVAEWINAAGGAFLKEDGKTPNIDTPEAKTGLTALVNMFKSGYIPKEALGWQESQSLADFQAGRSVFLRNWPYAVSQLAKPPSKVIGKVGLAPLPGPSGTGASTLGGHNIAISAFSKHKATALAFIKYMESEATQRTLIEKASLAPIIASLYTDPTLVKNFPYLPVLLKSIQTAVPRPVTPFYPAVSEAIQANTYAALQGTKSVDTALSDLQKALQVATNS